VLPALLPRFHGGLGREDVGGGSALLAVFCVGSGLGSGLGPGLACESADACWLSCESICRPGPRLFWHPPALPV
jgi:hypothetical protein